MLGTEQQVTEAYVETGQVKVVFWPVLNHGGPSVYSTLTAECVGQQDPALFWDVHHLLFANQPDLWNASRDYFVQTAVSVGADQATFEACYDDPAALATIQRLDEQRKNEWGIYSQPTFDINGTRLFGSLSFNSFQEVIDAKLDG